MSGKMEYHEAKVDEMVLALLYLTSFTERGITSVERTGLGCLEPTAREGSESAIRRARPNP